MVRLTATHGDAFLYYSIRESHVADACAHVRAAAIQLRDGCRSVASAPDGAAWLVLGGDAGVSVISACPPTAHSRGTPAEDGVPPNGSIDRATQTEGCLPMTGSGAAG